MIIIVTADFNEKVTSCLEKSAVALLQENNIEHEIYHVAGAVELPVATQKLIRLKKPKAVICLGCVIKGDTDHYDFVLRSCIDGLTRVSLDESVPVIQGILACQNFSQAWERRELGADYAHTAIRMSVFPEVTLKNSLTPHHS